MRTHDMLRGSSAGLAAFIHVDTTVGFLLDRERFVGLEPVGPSANAYVWRRVFLRGKGHRA